MYKWENQSKDCGVTEGDVSTKICKSLYNGDFNWYHERKPRVITSKTEDAVELYKCLQKFTVDLISKTSGIMREGLIKRLLKSEDVGLFINGDNCTSFVAIGNKKVKLNGITGIVNDIYVGVENLMSKELGKVYVELGYQYISEFSKSSLIGLRYYGVEDIEQEGVRICPVDLEPGLYDVDSRVIDLLLDKEKAEKIYRTEKSWKLYAGRGYVPGLVGVLKNVSTALSGACTGTRVIMKEVNGGAGFIDERQLYVEGTSAEVMSRIAPSVMNSLISSLISSLGTFEAVHSVKWDVNHLSLGQCLWCESSEKGAIDLWVR